jgi:hypothetical protein
MESVNPQGPASEYMKRPNKRRKKKWKKKKKEGKGPRKKKSFQSFKREKVKETKRE